MSDAYTPAWRRFPPVTLALATGFVGAYLLFLTQPQAAQDQIYENFALIPARFDPAGADPFRPWYAAIAPLFAHVFLHAGWLHVGMNTFAFMQGAPFVANRLGPWRFLILFTVSALGSAALFIALNLHSQQWAVGASGAICGVFGAYFLSVRRTWREALGDPQVRNAAFWFLAINVGLAGAARMTGFLPIAWEAHLGGFVTGVVTYLVIAPRRAGPWA